MGTLEQNQENIVQEIYRPLFRKRIIQNDNKTTNIISSNQVKLENFKRNFDQNHNQFKKLVKSTNLLGQIIWDAKILLSFFIHCTTIGGIGLVFSITRYIPFC